MCDFLLAFYSRLTSYFRTVSQLSSRICWKSWIFYSHLYLKSFTRTSRKVLTQYLTSLTGQNRLCFDKLHERDRQTDRQNCQGAIVLLIYIVLLSDSNGSPTKLNSVYSKSAQTASGLYIGTITSNCDSFFRAKPLSRVGRLQPAHWFTGCDANTSV